MVVYSGIEIDVAVIVACAPAIPALAKVFKARGRTKASHGSRNTLAPDSGSGPARRGVQVTTSIEQKTNFSGALASEATDRYIPLHDVEHGGQFTGHGVVHSEAWGGPGNGFR